MPRAYWFCKRWHKHCKHIFWYRLGLGLVVSGNNALMISSLQLLHVATSKCFIFSLHRFALCNVWGPGEVMSSRQCRIYRACGELVPWMHWSPLVHAAWQWLIVNMRYIILHTLVSSYIQNHFAKLISTGSSKSNYWNTEVMYAQNISKAFWLICRIKWCPWYIVGGWNGVPGHENHFRKFQISTIKMLSKLGVSIIFGCTTEVPRT